MSQWVLSIKTSLPNVCRSPEDLKTSIWVYDSFEEGKEALLNKLREFAFSENEMFDGDGHIINLTDYRLEKEGFEEEYDDIEIEEDKSDADALLDPDFLDSRSLMNTETIIRSAILGENVSLPCIPEESTDDMIAVKHDCETLKVYGDGDGPINGYIPHISMNIFDLDTEKDLFFYVDDMFGQEISSELYMDLKKTEN